MACTYISAFHVESERLLGISVRLIETRQILSTLNKLFSVLFGLIGPCSSNFEDVCAGCTCYPSCLCVTNGRVRRTWIGNRMPILCVTIVCQSCLAFEYLKPFLYRITLSLRPKRYHATTSQTPNTACEVYLGGSLVDLL